MSRKLLLQWDPEIDGVFRRRFERALGELQVDYADIAAVDPDDETHAIVILTSPLSRPPHHRDSNVPIILGGPGQTQSTNGALRLETSDIDNRTRRWITAADKLGAKLDRPGLATFAEADSDPGALTSAALAFPADPLAKDAAIALQPAVLQERLADEKRRADDAEQARDTAHRAQDHAARQLKLAEQQRFAAQMDSKKLAVEIDRLTAITESSAFALSNVAAAEREIVSAARDHAWRARLASARALDAAEAHSDALHWTKSHATYSGETKNGQPHGHGVMIFRRNDDIVAIYRGEFAHGLRAGHGVAISEGHHWTGQFANDEANGLGLLETSDGRRFEGAVSLDATGAPRRGRGWLWKSAAPVHQPVTPLLPSV
jgi:hypothetical protein